MNENNLKCPICGYIFSGDTESEIEICPLCSSEYKVKEAVELFSKTTVSNDISNPPQKSRRKIILEWIIFFLSFSAFIFVMYYILSYIIGNQLE